MKNDKELFDIHMRIRKELLPTIYEQLNIDDALEAKKNIFNKKKINADLAKCYSALVDEIYNVVWPYLYSTREEYKLAVSDVHKLSEGKSNIPNITTLGSLMEQLCFSLMSAALFKKRYYAGETTDKAHTEQLHDHYTNLALTIMEDILSTYNKGE